MRQSFSLSSSFGRKKQALELAYYISKEIFWGFVRGKIFPPYKCLGQNSFRDPIYAKIELSWRKSNLKGVFLCFLLCFNGVISTVETF
jgi:hypothetical protein